MKLVFLTVALFPRVPLNDDSGFSRWIVFQRHLAGPTVINLPDAFWGDIYEGTGSGNNEGIDPWKTADLIAGIPSC